ncbi:MAG: methyltransferase domain-containing protein [Nitrospirota bacterium]|nr:methyltransferase domain-containing protein [Nitrospirota bacterium]
MNTHQQLKEYYGKLLQSSSDLKTNACACGEDAAPLPIRRIIKDIHPEIIDRFYGCGSPIPPLLDGCTVLDLGCGTGRDAYIIAKLVGKSGKVIGVDMTDEQLEVARRHIDWQTDRFGYSKPNMEFHQGYIEDLAESGIADNSVDVVISNCVINLSPDKPSVFREIFRVLKPGGELYFSDVFADRRIPVALKDDPILRGECLSGAMYIEDFRRLLREIGCADYRVVNKTAITIDNDEVRSKIGMVNFWSITVRAFKLAEMEDICEDFGQVAAYRGSIPGHPHYFDLDDHHRFFTGKRMPVCGNTASMLQNTRFSNHFIVEGDRSVHFGPFACAPATSKAASADSPLGGACC